MHISEIKARTARTLALAYLDDDWYHRNIAQTARWMKQQGRGHVKYGGQFSTGNCWYEDGTIVRLEDITDIPREVIGSRIMVRNQRIEGDPEFEVELTGCPHYDALHKWWLVKYKKNGNSECAGFAVWTGDGWDDGPAA